MSPEAGARPGLVLATANPHKLVELTRILDAGHVDVRLLSLAEFAGAPQVAETGATFAENALLKAHAIAEFTGLPAVADDSGICVDALNGMPGVLSARWSGRHGDDEANLALLLAQLSDVPDERRGAQFVCAAALVLPGGREHVSEGIVKGSLIREPRGENGFGYDPIFVPGLRRHHHGRDGLGRQGQDQPPGQGPARTRAGHRCPAWLVSALPPSGRKRGMTGTRLAPGDAAPDFTLPDADGTEVSLSSLRGQRVIVYFYPAAMTPGCTKQACDFRDSLSSLAASGFAVIGISPDGPAKLKKFAERDGLTFPLLSDPDHEVLEAYGAYGEKVLYGKKSVGVIRSTVVVDAEGKVEKAQYGVKATGHVARLRAELGV